MYKTIYDHRRLSAFLLAFLLAFSFCSNCFAVAVAAVPIAVGAAVVVSSILVAAGLERTGEGFNRLVDSIVTTVRDELPTAFTAAGLMLGSLVEGKSLFPKSVIQSVLNAASDVGAFSSGSLTVTSDSSSFGSVYFIGWPSSIQIYDYFPFHVNFGNYSYEFNIINNSQPVFLVFYSVPDASGVFSNVFRAFSRSSFSYTNYDGSRSTARRSTYGSGQWTTGYYYSYYAGFDSVSPSVIINELQYGASSFDSSFYALDYQNSLVVSSSGTVSGVSNSGAYDGDKPIDEQLNDTITGWLANEQTLSISGTDVQSLPVSVADSLTGAAEQDQTAAQAGAISSTTAAAGVAAADQATQEAEYEDQLTVFEGIRDFAQDKIFPAISPILNKFPFSIPYDFYLMVSALGGTVPNGLAGVSDLDPSSVNVAPIGAEALADDDYTYTGSINLGVGDPVQLELDFSPWLSTFGVVKIMIGFLWTALILAWVSKGGQ